MVQTSEAEMYIYLFLNRVDIQHQHFAFLFSRRPVKKSQRERNNFFRIEKEGGNGHFYMSSTIHFMPPFH